LHAATAVSDTSDNCEENLPVRDDTVSRRPIQDAFRFTYDAHDVSYCVSFFNIQSTTRMIHHAYAEKKIVLLIKFIYLFICLC